MQQGLRKFRLATAKRLRQNATDAEQRLWRALRRVPTFGTHFRRQVAIGPYVADFACQRARLIVELDGSQHGDPAAAARDAQRTGWLESQGYRVLRFWNNDLSNMDAVLETIRAALNSFDEKPAASHPTPTRVARRPSPSRGG